MAFSKKYKTLGDVLLAYKIRHIKQKFKITDRVTAPQHLVDELEFDIAEIPFESSEATIREVLIFPILKAAWKPFSPQLTLWGHKAIDAGDELSGTPDYIISNRSALSNIVFEAPFVIVVEAKMDDFTGGWAQCALEMLAVQKLNGMPQLPVFGIMTNGDYWEFAKLENDLFVEFSSRYSIEDLNNIMSALNSIFELYKKYFNL